MTSESVSLRFSLPNKYYSTSLYILLLNNLNSNEARQLEPKFLGFRSSETFEIKKHRALYERQSKPNIHPR